MVPRLGAVTIGTGVVISGHLDVINEGKSPAKHVYTLARVIFVPREADVEPTYPPNQFAWFETPYVFAGQEPESFKTTPEILARNADGSKRIATDTDWDDFERGRIDVLFFARITYVDSLNARHWVNACRVFASNSSDGPTAHVKCIRYNQSDNDSPVPTPSASKIEAPDSGD